MERKKKEFSLVFLMGMVNMVRNVPSFAVIMYLSSHYLLIFQIEKCITSHSSVSSAESFISENLKKCNAAMHEQRFSCGPDDVSFLILFSSLRPTAVRPQCASPL